MWGAPGTLLAALALGEWTGEPRWEEAARETATALRARRGDDWLWRQDDDYRGLGTVHGAAGNTLVLLRLDADDALAAETAAVLARTAFREGGLANWPGSPRPQLAGTDGRIRLQWCTGAPGVLAGACEYLDEELLLAGAELIWRAGAHRDEKGHGICHGTSGNGFALLKASTRSASPSGSALRTAAAVTRSGPAMSSRAAMRVAGCRLELLDARRQVFVRHAGEEHLPQLRASVR
jgi:lantibiotic modifying enzyme